MIDIEKQKLSIIVISYNQENYIRKTLDSILNQKHNFSFEIIVCDDASKDSTPQIIKDYASQYKEIVPVLRHENQGVVKNYFDAVSRCQGEYLMVCAGDDYWLPGKVEKQISFMDSHPNIGACTGDAITINEYGKKTGYIYCKEDSSFESLLISNCAPACSICYRFSLLKKYIEDVDPVSHNWLMEDLPLNIWFSVNSQIFYLKGECVAYRVLPNSLSHFDENQYKRWVAYRNSAFALRTYFINKYPEKSVRVKNKVAYLYIKELMLERTFSHPELKNKLKEILLDVPFLNICTRKVFYLANNYNFLNKIFAKSYLTMNSKFCSGVKKHVKSLFRYLIQWHGIK